MSEVDTADASLRKVNERVVSVDALRGFDMFWLVGGMGFAKAIVMLMGTRAQEVLIPQSEHAEWVGFTFYDLIFPLFVFIMGIALPFSLGKIIETQGVSAAYVRVFRRTALMLAMGFIYYGGFSNLWPEIRLLGVLQRIALCYLFAGLLFCHLDWRGLIAAGLVCLVSYWALLSFVPLPGATEISFEAEKNWATYIDAQYLPGHKHNGTWDPEGLLSTVPAVASCLLGVLCGLLLQHRTLSQHRKLAILIGGGLVLTLLGYAWGLQFPVIKKIWTSSYVLVAGGYSCVLLGLFYLVVDVWQVRWWIQPFVWIGANPLTIYMARQILDFNELGDRFAGGNIQALFSDPVADLIHTSASLALSMLFVWFLYSRKIFLRL